MSCGLEIRECVTLIIQQHVLWFEVSVDDPLLVEVLHALDDLSGVVAGSWLVKPRVVLIYIINVIPRCIREGGVHGFIWQNVLQNSNRITYTVCRFIQ